MEIMGDNIAVLLTHGSLLRRYQTLYLVNWVHGRVQCVSHALGLSRPP